MKKSIAILLVALMGLTVISTAGIVSAAPPMQRQREVFRAPVYMDVGREGRGEAHVLVAILVVRESANGRLDWRIEQVRFIDRHSGDAVLVKERRIDFNRFSTDQLVFLKGHVIFLKLRDGWIIRGSGSLGKGDLDQLRFSLRGYLLEIHRLHRVGDERSLF